jgi:NAD(P)-dependent dehydrogenase (short-subunit alcohol dehydrogenase family)
MARVVIFGGTGGIGAAVAQQLVERGDSVHLVARDAARLEASASLLGATYTVGDVCDETLFARVANEAGDVVDGLVYAVGTITLRPLARLTSVQFEHDWRVNALGAALAIQALTPSLKRSDAASVVLFSSVAAAQGFTSHASISMAKAAVSGLTVAMAAELAPKVRVNAIAPSLTRTGLAAGLLGSEQMASAIAALHAIPRIGEPSDMSGLTVFLLGTQSAWMTGQVIAVDGGRSTVRTKG